MRAMAHYLRVPYAMMLFTARAMLMRVRCRAMPMRYTRKMLRCAYAFMPRDDAARRSMFMRYKDDDDVILLRC